MVDDKVVFVLDKQTAEALYEYLRHEFISYEHHPKVIELVKTLRKEFHHG